MCEIPEYCSSPGSARVIVLQDLAGDDGRADI